ncbi:serine hydrolase domain-containing protein [Zavarzinia compransoris]|uniref:1,4-butanediol diacrylate esterase n=1 Tax=Zavarzinia compransoris TaxID=1264899 RepID=A0A317E9Z8_9PROT|nr:serine hydrolase domain-containing protein [Zavarzinia compransoris]PWR23938.1 1,4-butanediol diacrylate esterase [Zavarzinia compransoris]TDP48185.1 methyl acetate hydrolase [Zavarzinia compransoris]
MGNSVLKAAADAVLSEATATGKVPGVVAEVSDRDGPLYRGAAGLRGLEGTAAMTADTVFCIFSCTKAVTGTAILQLVEGGSLDLDAPAKTYVPEIGEIQVLDGFDAAGRPRLRAPKRDITTRMLMLHTSGMGYDFLDPNLRDYVALKGIPSIVSSTRAAITLPLTFDPGERWQYGLSIDWCGQVVEAIAGKRLGAVLADQVFAPLGMRDTGFSRRPDMDARLATVHQRLEDGSLLPVPELRLPDAPEVELGGAGLYSTVGDYGRFLRLWLNDGQGEFGRVLKPETVRFAMANGLGTLKVTPVTTAVPQLSLDAEFFPGQSKSWAYSFMVNDETAPTGRSAGSVGWAGLANLFYWIDCTKGIAGFWAAQVLPFADPGAAGAYLGFESAVYNALAQSRAA